MPEYMLLMHSDSTGADEGGWERYLAKLRASGRFEGGSAIGEGICVNKAGKAVELSRRLTGYLRVTADSLDDARALLGGNPVYEAGGTIEVRELPRS